MSVRTIRWLALFLCVFVPKLGFAAFYVVPPTLGPPVRFGQSSLGADVSFLGVDSALYADPIYVDLAQRFDVIAFAMSFVPLVRSANDLVLTSLTVTAGTAIVQLQGFVPDDGSVPSFAGSIRYPDAYFRFDDPAETPLNRHADGSFETPTLVLLYLPGTFSESPIASQLAIGGVWWRTSPSSSLSFYLPPGAPIFAPEPPVAVLAFAALTALTLARR